MVKNQFVGSSIRLHWAFLCIIILVSPLFLFRLAQSPYSWYDEGLNINAAQTLANTGVYGLSTQTGIRLADPAIQSGPPLIALIGIVGKLFNNSLFAIRFVMFVFGVLTLTSLYALAYRLYGQFAAFLLVILLIAIPANDTTSTFILLSRQFLGEVPAVLCISLGCHLLLRSRPRIWSYALTGVFWGLAIILKSQVLLVFSATVGLWILYRIVTNKPDKFYWLITAFVMFGLYGCDTLWRGYMAGSMLADNLVVLREGIGIHILAFRALKNLRDLSTVVRVAFSVVTVGAAIFFLRPQGKQGAQPQQTVQQVHAVQNFILLLIGIWMFWYAFVSIGWGRYSFVGVVFTCVILAGVLSSISLRIHLPINKYMYASLLVLAVLASYIINIPRLQDTTGDDFFNIVADIQTNIPSSARIVSLEWAADNFLPQHFIYPTTHVINVITQNAFHNTNISYTFDSLAECPQYVLLGSLNLDATVLKDALKISDPKPLFKEGIYQLFEVNKDQLPASCKTG